MAGASYNGFLKEGQKFDANDWAAIDHIVRNGAQLIETSKQHEREDPAMEEAVNDLVKYLEGDASEWATSAAEHTVVDEGIGAVGAAVKTALDCVNGVAANKVMCVDEFVHREPVNFFEPELVCLEPEVVCLEPEVICIEPEVMCTDPAVIRLELPDDIPTLRHIMHGGPILVKSTTTSTEEATQLPPVVPVPARRDFSSQLNQLIETHYWLNNATRLCHQAAECYRELQEMPQVTHLTPSREQVLVFYWAVLLFERNVAIVSRPPFVWKCEGFFARVNPVDKPTVCELKVDPIAKQHVDRCLSQLLNLIAVTSGYTLRYAPELLRTTLMDNTLHAAVRLKEALEPDEGRDPAQFRLPFGHHAFFGIIRRQKFYQVVTTEEADNLCKL